MDNANYELKNKDLHLVKADKENFWTLMDLRVSKDQEEFVAPNSVSLAQAYDTRADGKFVQSFGIWDGDTPVGFAMIGHNSEEYEEMDQRYQKRGYGRDALKLLLDYIRTFPDGVESLWSTSWEPGNDVAAKLYHDFGFIENGEKDGDEIVAVLEL